jgi:hypothetical protein
LLPLPKPASFGNHGLYFIFAGENDIIYAIFANSTGDRIRSVILPEIVSNVSLAITVDGIHYTEALYKQVATTILQGKFVDLTGINFSSLCDLDFSKSNDKEEFIHMSPFCQ